MERFGNIFDIPEDWPGDDAGNNNQESEIRLEEYYQDFDFNYIYTNVDIEEMITEENDDHQVQSLIHVCVTNRYNIFCIIVDYLDTERTNSITKIKSIVNEG